MNEVLNERGVEMIVTDAMSEKLYQLAMWFSRDSGFKGSLKKGLLIRGGVGTGKTVISESLRRTILKVERINSAFINAYDLQFAYAKQDEELITRHKNCKYAIIDDVGVEAVETRYYGNVIEPFNDLFDHRYRMNKMTIITTNLLISQLTDRYGIRITDRFRECLNDIVIDGKSLRK